MSAPATPQPLAIAVLGAGNIGRTLGAAWARAGHRVTFGLRDQEGESGRAVRAELGEGATIAPVAEAIGAAEVVVLAVPGGAVDDVVAEHAAALNGKVVVDAANRAFGSPGPQNSLATLERLVPGARVVRAFNSLGWENFADPTFGGERADLFYCGAPEARTLAERLIADVGLRPIRVGGLDRMAAVDAVVGLWAALAFGGWGRHVAFKVLGEEGR